jgi:hypothetical protein
LSVLTFPARLSVEDGRARRGRLRLAPGGITWRSGLRSSTDLTCAAVLTAAMRRVRHRRGDVEVRLRLADGRSARLELPEAEAAATVRMLSGRDAPGLDPVRIRHSGRTWWATACLTVAGLWVALMVAMAFDGYTATGTVVRSAGTWTCAVTWQSPSGTPEQDDTDCFGEPPGSSLEVLVPYGDYEGAVTTRPMLALVGVTGALPLAAIGALRFRVVARRHRTNVALIRLAAQLRVQPRDDLVEHRRDVVVPDRAELGEAHRSPGVHDVPPAGRQGRAQPRRDLVGAGQPAQREIGVRRHRCSVTSPFMPPLGWRAG